MALASPQGGAVEGMISVHDMIKSPVSDYFTRLKYVYLTATQWEALGSNGGNIWFIILV